MIKENVVVQVPECKNCGDKEPIIDPDDIWLCRCDCGRETNVRGEDLRSGKSTSCGMCKKDN